MDTINNKRLVKNTLLLYVRMILTMFVGLFTVRIVLNTLGVIDFGLFGVIGGLVSVLGFLGVTMTTTAQRFFAFEIGRKDEVKLNLIFNNVFIIFITISLFVVIMMESFGYWFLNERMEIPVNRLEASKWVFQFAILTYVLNTLTIPYQSILIARENFKLYAYITIVDVFLKLIIVVFLIFYSFDKLKLYALLMFLSSAITTFIYRYYSKKKYSETKFKLSFDKRILSNILSFAGWNMIGAVSNTLKTNGVNIILNLFFGPVVNAARGIAFQVSGMIQNLMANFNLALKPQITKAYASGDFRYFKNLVFKSSKYSFFIVLTLTMPLMLETNYIINFWLNQIPQNVISFTRLMIIYVVIDTMNNQLASALQASGKIKLYQGTISIILLFNLPITYFLFLYGAPPWTTFLISIILILICFYPQLLITKKILGFSISSYLKEVTLLMVIVILSSYMLPLIVYANLEYGFNRFILVCLTSLFSCFISIYFIGLDGNEKSKIKTYTNKFIINSFKSR